MREVWATEVSPKQYGSNKPNTGHLGSPLSPNKYFTSNSEQRVDFNLFKMVYENMRSQSKDSKPSVNFCLNHPNKVIEYICCDEMVGICVDCLYNSYPKNSEIIPIKETMRTVKKMLLDIEKDSIKIVQEKNLLLKEIETQAETIEQQKQEFVSEQQQKIEELHKYLDDKFSFIVSKYNESIEQHLLKVYNQQEIVSKEIEESLEYLKKLQRMTERMNYEEPKVIIEDLVLAGKQFKDYKQMKELSIKEAYSFKNTFSTHLMDIKPMKAIKVEEEIQILTQKYDELNYGLDERNNSDTKLIRPKKQFPTDKIRRIPQIRKIYLPRWMSKTVAEYDVDNPLEGWITSNCKTSLDFFPFSAFAYLPNYQILSIGGLNNKIPNKSTFSSRVVRVNIQNLNLKKLDELVYYSCEEMQSMNIPRGMMGCTRSNGYIYVAGGVSNKVKNSTTSVLNKCERYNIDENYWEVIAPMNQKRKNPSLWALGNGIIYVFGGWQREYTDVEVVEKYWQAAQTKDNLSIDEYVWESLMVYMPDFFSMQVSHCIDNNKIFLFGGWSEDRDRKGYSKNVFSFMVDTESFYQEKDLEETLVSIYPAFECEKSILLINEDQKEQCPKIISYNEI